MTVKDVLIAARKLIEDPAHWAQGALAKTAQDRFVGALHPKACRWCAMGALAKASQGTDDETFDKALVKLGEQLPNQPEAPTFMPVGYFNDSHTHKEVLELFDKTIAKCQ